MSSFLDFLPLVDTPEKAQFHLQWARDNERWVRADERRHLAELVQAAVDIEYVTLQQALKDIAPETRASCATLVRVLTEVLAGDEQESEAA